MQFHPTGLEEMGISMVLIDGLGLDLPLRPIRASSTSDSVSSRMQMKDEKKKMVKRRNAPGKRWSTVPVSSRGYRFLFARS